MLLFLLLYCMFLFLFSSVLNVCAWIFACEINKWNEMKWNHCQTCKTRVFFSFTTLLQLKWPSESIFTELLLKAFYAGINQVTITKGNLNVTTTLLVLYQTNMAGLTMLSRNKSQVYVHLDCWFSSFVFCCSLTITTMTGDPTFYLVPAFSIRYEQNWF